MLFRSNRFRIRGWQALDPKKLDDAKGHIHRGNPVVFGMDISADFEIWTGDRIYDDTTSPRTGGHAMVIVGYSEAKQAFKIINSWGEWWGDKGYGWISYRAMRALADRQFVMEVGDLPPFPAPKPVAPVTPGPIAVVVPPAPAPVVVTPPEPKPEPKPAPVVVIPPKIGRAHV